MKVVQLASVKSSSASHVNARHRGRTSDSSSAANKSPPVPNETLLCNEWSALTSLHAGAFSGSECSRV
jgi:hypothetical protein